MKKTTYAGFCPNSGIYMVQNEGTADERRFLLLGMHEVTQCVRDGLNPRYDTWYTAFQPECGRKTTIRNFADDDRRAMNWPVRLAVADRLVELEMFEAAEAVLDQRYDCEVSNRTIKRAVNRAVSECAIEVSTWRRQPMLEMPNAQSGTVIRKAEQPTLGPRVDRSRKIRHLTARRVRRAGSDPFEGLDTRFGYDVKSADPDRGFTDPVIGISAAELAESPDLAFQLWDSGAMLSELGASGDRGDCRMRAGFAAEGLRAYPVVPDAEPAPVSDVLLAVAEATA